MQSFHMDLHQSISDVHHRIVPSEILAFWSKVDESLVEDFAKDFHHPEEFYPQLQLSKVLQHVVQQ